MAAARAEAAWLDGELAGAVAELHVAYDMALERTNPWATGELALWLWRAGALEEVPDAVAEPYGLHMRGDARGAADAWGRMGFPYERALALADDGDASAAREGLRILRELGASR
ncbi:MAG: hypothetical protein GWN02_03455, partial [Gemmatimonadetes bacterium]|nr:hypothetical protein [Gemmatimonadota bacterium]